MEGNQGYRGRFATHVPTSRSMYKHETLSVPIFTLSNNNTAPISIQPGISQVTHLSLAIVFTALFALLFLMILLQLCLILYFGHRRLSYQTVFLFIYLFWASLRTTLFSFYFNDSSGTDSLSLLLKWLLFSLPIYLQFLTLSLLTLYLSKVRNPPRWLPV